MGIVSCLGTDKDSVLSALQEGRSGIKFQEEYKELGFRSQAIGSANPMPARALWAMH
jgi:3-oxoacyl-[acyl-carrier-protein] synthase-1